MTARLLRMRVEAVLLPLVILAGVASYRVNTWIEQRVVERAADGDVGALPDGKVLNVASLGFERAVADLFWIRTVYYVGDNVAAEHGWPGAERLAHLVTDIDPQFDSVYVLMASVLNGLRKDPDAAIRLLEKGAAISSYWRIHFLLGFQYFMEKQDYVRGAKCLERAIELGGPTYLQFLVSRLYASAGDPTTAMGFIQLRLQNEETPAVRAQLEKRYVDLWINRDLAAIDGAIDAYRAAKHAEPADVASLVRAGLLPSEPRDPHGGAYRIADGRATTDLAHEVLELKLPGRK